MGYYFGIVILALFAVLQNTVLSEFRLLNGQAELVMLAVMAWSWHANDTEAVFWAVCGGLMQDLLNPIIPTGLSPITFVTMVLVLKSIAQNLYQFSIFALLALVSAATLMHHILILILFSIQGYSIDLSDYMREFTIPTLAFNLLLILPLYWLLRRIQKRISPRHAGYNVSSH